MEEENPVKKYLFSHIEKSEKKFQILFSDSKMDKIIDDILENCYLKVSLMDNKEESLGILATGILHYMLTNSLISSQRKIEYKGTEIDIVIPDIRTLEKDPNKTLIILIPKTIDKKIVDKRIKQLQKIQPVKQNIWLVLMKNLDFENTTYVLKKDGSSFLKIIFDIGKFLNVQGENKLKILRV